MAYDEGLADRIRDVVADLGVPAVERKMFGGLAFLVGGHMAVAASGEGGLMLRCAPEDTERVLDAGAEPMVMRGREMRGWVRVTEPGDEVSLRRWVKVGTDFASSQPPKEGSA